MSNREPGFDALMRDHLRQSRQPAGDHPSPEVLAAYQADQLGPAQDEAVREHLVACEDCSSLVLELAGLVSRADQTGPEVAEFETAAAWRRMRPRLFGGGHAAPSRGRWSAVPARQVWAAAAALACVSLGLVVWLAIQQQALVELRRPRINPPLVNLEPVGAVREPPAAARTVAFSAQTPRAWLILNPATELGFAAYRVEFFDADQGARWTVDGLTPSEAGNFRIELARDLLPAGDYRIVLSGLERGEVAVAEEYALRITEF